jgi:hypothetical protein
MIGTPNLPIKTKIFLKKSMFSSLIVKRIACHVLEHIGDPNSQHKISIDNVSRTKEMRRPKQLDAYEGIYIMQRNKKNAELMNGDEDNVRSRLFDVLFLKQQTLRKISV